MSGRPREILLALVAFALLLWCIIYPLLMASLAYLRQGASQTGTPAHLAASVVIATRVDLDVIALRIGNIERYRCELERLEIIVALDRVGNLNANACQDLISNRARIVEGDPPGGKAATLNAGVRAASEHVVIFADFS